MVASLSFYQVKPSFLNVVQYSANMQRLDGQSEPGRGFTQPFPQPPAEYCTTCVEEGLLHSEPAPLHRRAKNGHAWVGGRGGRGRSDSIPSLRHDPTPCMSHGGTYPACIVARTTPGVPKLLSLSNDWYEQSCKLETDCCGTFRESGQVSKMVCPPFRLVSHSDP